MFAFRLFLEGVSYSQESLGSHHGQQDFAIYAHDSKTRELIGKLNYSVFEDESYINMVTVRPDRRGEGIAKQMVHELTKEFPYHKIQWGMMTDDGAGLKKSLDKEYNLSSLIDNIKKQYPGIHIEVYENPQKINLSSIIVPQKNQGIGTKVVNMIKDYAKKVRKPIVLIPDAEKGKKQALDRFYKNLGFVANKGRKVDYSLSSPFAKTMYWKP